ncbi:MAG: hypothetical protein M3350_07500 [Actinomycetota bacterium]|nr:hypothetical protein [Actinomycetota bacterium]
MPTLHATEHRGYRELFAFSRSLSTHWGQLAERLPPTSARPFREGASAARELTGQLETHAEAYDLHGKPAAQGLGNSIGMARASLRNRFLEVNQATRFALGEIAHVVSLLGYLLRVAETRDDARARSFCSGWLERLDEIESQARGAAAELGADPDSAIEPYDPSPLGKAGQSVGAALGRAGEWVDQQMAKRG